MSTVGRVQPHAEVKIVDLEGRTVPLGVQGEICTRGYLVMQGYWNGAKETADAIDRARWMHTGDLGKMDADGYLAITGRSKDMVIRGGENVYPREVEEFLYGHPAVADVQVFGVPDKVYGEELCAWIILKAAAAATEDDIKAFCRGRITHFKIPRYVRFVTSYPNDGDRQGAEICHARDDGEGTGRRDNGGVTACHGWPPACHCEERSDEPISRLTSRPCSRGQKIAASLRFSHETSSPPPLCGRGLGEGVAASSLAFVSTPSPTPSHKGRGDSARIAQFHQDGSAAAGRAICFQSA